MNGGEDRELDARLRREFLAQDFDGGGAAALERRIHERIAARERTVRAARRIGLAASGAAVLLGAGLFYRATVGGVLPWGGAHLLAAAEQDHYREVVERQPRRWISNVTEAGQLASRHALPASLITSVVPPGAHFEGARLCFLNGQLFLHLVYSREVPSSGAPGGKTEFSVFLRKAGSLHGLAQETSINGEHVAGVGKDRMVAMFVTAQPGEALSLARFAAAVL
jgi:hypothetical protein